MRDFVGIPQSLTPIITDTYYQTCMPNPIVDKCLEDILGEPVNEVDVIEDPIFSGWHGAKATTRENTIYPRDCDELWSDEHMILEEYYHVLKQWNTGRMGRISYVRESWKQEDMGNHPYWDNKYEKEAKSFADKNKKKLKDCINKAESISCFSRYKSDEEEDDEDY